MIFAVLVGVAVALGYFLNQYLLTYWKRHGFKQLEPKFFFGDIKPLMTLKSSAGEHFQQLYNKHKKLGIMGVYLSYIPSILVTDPKLIQDILIRDFSSFHDRNMPFDEVHDPISAGLFHIEGQKWRDLRVKLSPTFTSGKLKGMLPIIKDCGQVLQDYLLKNVKYDIDVFEFRDVMARYNTNIISSVAFGIDNDCINEPDHIFRKMGSRFFEPSLMNGIRNLVTFAAPQLFYKLKLTMVDKDVDEFMFSIVKQTIEHREQKNFSRNDFMQLLIQLKNQGFVSVDKDEKNVEEVQDGSENLTKIDINAIVAQAYLFFIAGFETSSSTMSFALFELARNPEIQKKVSQEIDKVLEAAGPEGLTYEMLGELKYLEACIDETLRKYPIVPVLLRKATRDYKVGDSNSIIPKGTAVNIPVLALHRDPEIFENPLEFKPERFLNSSNGGGKSEGIFYTPFGDGPRNCIGMRMGKLTSKIGLFVILSKFSLEHTDKEMLSSELEFHPNQFSLTPKKLFNIKIARR